MWKAKTTTKAPPAATAAAVADPPAPDVLAGDDLHTQIVEAVKVLTSRQDEYARALSSLDAQYLKPLEAAHDGDSPACLSVLAQVKAVRALF